MSAKAMTVGSVVSVRRYPVKSNGTWLSAIANHHPYLKWQLRSCRVRSNL